VDGPHEHPVQPVEHVASDPIGGALLDPSLERCGCPFRERERHDR
jgi:hypothetical protein